jgi:E3 ubiquitin-protein ligase RGLG
MNIKTNNDIKMNYDVTFDRVSLNIHFL